MFGHRSDGVELKNISPEFKIIPSLMTERDDSQVFFNQDIVVTPIENYINKKAEEGYKFTYMDVIFAAVLRIIAKRPRLNRFVINGRIYARNSITISLTIKKSLSDEADESNLKIPFDGTETIFEVRDKIEKLIEENKSDPADNNSTDKTAKIISMIPTCFIKLVVWMIKKLDKHGYLPKALIKVSPFHTSAYITNVGSLGINSIYHHLYNFGTTSMFFAMGKRKKSYVYEDDEIKEEKCINIAFVGDERICDGYYYAHSFRQLCKYLAKPELLEKPGELVLDDEISDETKYQEPSFSE
ncbi:MAG: 2-oxo acid dehydrogenase subunit E2 [Clostridia bacterium]|nr:2-oxo acid dehydrogenase subunit E2 [Clostridia bacterium]